MNVSTPKLLFCGLVIGLCACDRVVVNRGYNAVLENFSKIKPGVDTANSVFEKLGAPSFRSTVIGDNGTYCWYYSAKQMTKFGFMPPKTIRSITYAVTFNSSDTVKSINRVSEEHHIRFIEDTVSTKLGKNKGVFKEVFGGMGKYIEAYSKDK